MKRINIKKESIIKFILENKLFLVYTLLCIIIGLLLRIKTCGLPLHFKATLSDTFVILLVGSFGYLFKHKKSRFKYYMIWITFFSLLSIGNTIYYGFYQSYLSVNLIGTASMLGEVNDALFAKLRFNHFIFIFFPIIYFILYKYLNKHGYFEENDIDIDSSSKKTFLGILAILPIILIIVIITFTKADGSRFVKLWNREYIVKKYGIYVYTANDLVQSIQPRLNTFFGYDEAANKFRDFYACKWEEKKNTNEYTNKFKGKNVLFIHAESIQNFLINLKINGNEVTPNLNRLASEGIYFNRFYPQISIGTSSDTEFTLSTGLMPSSSGTVFVNYYDRKYYALPGYFNNLGYYTFSTHANNADYWNRKTMHIAFGYHDFYAKESYVVPTDENDPEYVGLGLSDKSFFEQFVPKLKNISKTKTPYMGNIITLSNHSPFSSIDKYGEFDLTVDYEYEDENGDIVSGSDSYLENTSLGNYLKSSHYADSALGVLFENLKNEDLLKNTIIILYGDHEARLGKKDFDLLYNYDVKTSSIKSNTDEDYYNVYGYNYDLLKNTPLIIWSGDEEFNLEINNAMGMYDVLPTVANMFGFEEKYSLGHDIFDDHYENIVVFPNGNVLTDQVYYSDLNDEYISFNDNPISTDYIDKLRNYANEILEVSNGIVVHDLIRLEGKEIGRCVHEEKN